MAHVKSGGSTSNVRDSKGQRLGVKAFGGEKVVAGNIIIRQRGTSFRAGTNVMRGSDDTLQAVADGKVRFEHKKVKKFNGALRKTIYVHVDPVGAKQKVKTAKSK